MIYARPPLLRRRARFYSAAATDSPGAAPPFSSPIRHFLFCRCHAIFAAAAAAEPRRLLLTPSLRGRPDAAARRCEAPSAAAMMPPARHAADMSAAPYAGGDTAPLICQR